MSNDKLAEYKLFVDSTQHLSERRQAATNLPYGKYRHLCHPGAAGEGSRSEGLVSGRGQPSTLSCGHSGLPDLVQHYNSVQSADRLALRSAHGDGAGDVRELSHVREGVGRIFQAQAGEKEVRLFALGSL